MGPSFTGCLLLTLAVTAQGTVAGASARGGGASTLWNRATLAAMSIEDFSNWHLANTAGQVALGQGNLDAADHRFRNAIDIARPAAARDPRPLARTYTDY